MREFILPHLFDLVCLGVSMALFTAYNVFIWWRLKGNPIYTVQGATSMARKSWVVQVMEERSDILAVQTLRNSTMAATFLASTAILLSVGVLTLTGQAEKIGETWRTLNLFGSTEQSMLAIKLLILLGNLFVAFFSFSSSIRLFNHVGFMINVPCSERDYSTSITFVAIQLDRAARHFHNGMRAFYFMVPLVFWFFGPLLLVAATMVMIAVIYGIDKTPAMDYDYISTFSHKRCKL